VYSVFYEIISMPGCGYEFPSDEDGVIDRDNLCECAKESLIQCESGKVDGKAVKRRVVRERLPDAKLSNCALEKFGCVKTAPLAKHKPSDFSGFPNLENKRTSYDWWEEI
jgi:hypothetical protein